MDTAHRTRIVGLLATILAIAIAIGCVYLWGHYTATAGAYTLIVVKPPINQPPRRSAKARSFSLQYPPAAPTTTIDWRSRHLP